MGHPNDEDDDVFVVYKVSENPSDELEYWLSPESSATQPTATSVAALPGISDTTKQQLDRKSTDDNEGPVSVG